MFFYLTIKSKNKNSLNTFLKIFKKILSKNTFNFTSNKKSIKRFTFLKSPHVNKTAQEHFEYTIYTKQFKIHSSKSSLLLVFLKKLKHNVFFDVMFKIELVNQPLKYTQKLKNNLNPDNFLLVSNNTCLELYINVLNSYGSLVLKQKTNVV